MEKKREGRAVMLKWGRGGSDVAGSGPISLADVGSGASQRWETGPTGGAHLSVTLGERGVGQPA
uniref:Uncharacterized protein n=1 Tax=Oryza sativa subsp. japonica TaxID=39947 RepID=Q84ST0_ORYSJ|nr:hypothetical protein Os03g45090 [Oryza sativa Japonica Group]